MVRRKYYTIIEREEERERERERERVATLFHRMQRNLIIRDSTRSMVNTVNGLCHWL